MHNFGRSHAENLPYSDRVLIEDFADSRTGGLPSSLPACNLCHEPLALYLPLLLWPNVHYESTCWTPVT